MNTYQILALCAAIAIALPIIVIIVRSRKLPESISGLSYTMPDGVFTAWMALVGILLAPALFDMAHGWERYLIFAMLACLFAVASSPYYKESGKVVHTIAGWIAAICATVFVYFESEVWLLTWFLFPPFVNRIYRVFIAELICLVALFLTIFYCIPI